MQLYKCFDPTIAEAYGNTDCQVFMRGGYKITKIFA